MVDPIRYVGFWNWRTSNCQVPQNPNVLSDRPIRGFRHNDVSTARGVGDQREDDRAHDTFDGQRPHDDHVAQVASAPHVRCRFGGAVAGWFAHHESFASQTSPRVTGRSLDPQSGLQLGFVRGEGGVAAQPTGVKGDIHADREYGCNGAQMTRRASGHDHLFLGWRRRHPFLFAFRHWRSLTRAHGYSGKGVIRIERAVARIGDGFQVTTPKSDAGTRDVAMPPHLVPVIAGHLAKHVGPEQDSLLFPARHGGTWRQLRCTGSSIRHATRRTGPI